MHLTLILMLHYLAEVVVWSFTLHKWIHSG